jgi:hypothetical protein
MYNKPYKMVKCDHNDKYKFDVQSEDEYVRYFCRTCSKPIKELNGEFYEDDSLEDFPKNGGCDHNNKFKPMIQVQDGYIRYYCKDCKFVIKERNGNIMFEYNLDMIEFVKSRVK